MEKLEKQKYVNFERLKSITKDPEAITNDPDLYYERSKPITNDPGAITNDWKNQDFEFSMCFNGF